MSAPVEEVVELDTFEDPQVEDHVVEDHLVEDISIDGMCGVY